MRVVALAVCYLWASAAAAQAHPAPGGPPAYRISGIVVDAATQVPVARAEVILADRQEIEAVAGEDGRFTFDGLAPGKYVLAARARGYVRELYQQHQNFTTSIAVGSGLDSTHLVFPLHRQAVIRGRITDDRGEPVRGAPVELVVSEVSWGKRHESGRQATTNDLGEFRFSGLRAGRYRVSVLANPWYARTPMNHPELLYKQSGAANIGVIPLLDVAYPPTFYPGVTNPGSAGDIAVAPGETADASMQLQAVPAVHLHLTGVPLANKETLAVHVRYRDASLARIVVVPSAVPVGPGEYEVDGLASGDATVLLSRGSGSDSIAVINAALTPGDDTLDASAAPVSVPVSGVVVLPSGLVVPAESTVNIWSSDVPPFSSALAKDGSFSFPSVATGEYNIDVALPHKDAYIQSLSAEGAEASGRRLSIEGSAQVRVRIVVGIGRAQLSGVAMRDGKPAAAVFVLLVPASPGYAESDARMDQSDSDGTFSLGEVAPGSYLLLAITDGWDLEWDKTEVLRPYLEKAQHLEVAANETRSVVVQAVARLQP